MIRCDDRKANLDENTSLNKITQRGGFRPQSYSRGRGNQPNNFRGGGNQFRRNQRKLVCRHCSWLKEHWGIWEIDTDHDTKTCRREMPAEVKMILQDKEEYPWTEEEEDNSELQSEENSGQSWYNTKYENGILYFQKSERKLEKPVETTPGNQEQDRRHTPGQPPQYLTSKPVSDSPEPKIKLIRDTTSPIIQGTFNHTKITALVDEGSGTNATDVEFTTKHKIKVVPTKR